MRRCAACVRWLPLVTLVGCGPQRLDVLVHPEDVDACTGFTTEQDCNDSRSLDCWFEPNPEGCRSDDPACPPGVCRQGLTEAFVRTEDQRLWLRDAPFRFVGVSSWGLLPQELCASTPASERAQWIQDAFDALLPSHTKVARFYAFQSSAGANGEDFTYFDAAVHAARRAGIHVQLMLDDAKAACSLPLQPMQPPRDVAWYSGGYEKLDGTYTKSYRDFAISVAKRYADDPTVLGYVLIHGFGDTGDATTLAPFVTTMGDKIHEAAPHQLLSIDLEWNTQGDNGATYRQLQQLPQVDFVDMDDYVSALPPPPMNAQQLTILADIGKPVVVGEEAFYLSTTDPDPFILRATEMQKRIAAWHDAGLAGALLWAYDPGWTDTSEEFDTRPADPILQANGVVATEPW